MWKSRANLTVNQISTGLKDFWVIFFFEWPNWKKKSIFYLCVFVFQMFAESIIDSMQLLDQDTAVLCSYTLVLHSKCRQIGSQGLRFYMRIGERASTQTRWSRSSAPGNSVDSLLNSEHLNANLPSALRLNMPLWNSFVFALFVLNRKKEIQHLRKLIVT